MVGLNYAAQIRVPQPEDVKNQAFVTNDGGETDSTSKKDRQLIGT